MSKAPILFILGKRAGLLLSRLMNLCVTPNRPERPQIKRGKNDL